MVCDDECCKSRTRFFRDIHFKNPSRFTLPLCLNPASPCLCHMSMSMVHFHADVGYLDQGRMPMSMICVFVNAAFYVRAACQCPCCMFMSMLHVHVHDACSYPCSMFYCMFMSRLHVHAAYSCFLSMRHVHVSILHVPATCLCCLFMLHDHAACPCCM
jgi:hypothetical protein